MLYLLLVKLDSLYTCLTCVLAYYDLQASLYNCLITPFIYFFFLLAVTISSSFCPQGKEGESQVTLNVICDRRGTTDPVSYLYLLFFLSLSSTFFTLFSLP